MPAYNMYWRRDLPLKLSLWIALGFVSFVFCAVGIVELVMPIPKLSHILPWVEQHPLWFTRSLGVIDIAGGIGILLPTLFTGLPRLIRYAAVGCASKQVVAIVFHLTNGEPSVVPLNIALLILSLFISWSRTEAAKTLFTNRAQQSN